MKVFLATAGLPRERSAILDWELLAARDTARRHVLTGDPDDADIVLFTDCNQLAPDWRLSAIRDAPVTRRFRDKVYVYDQQDRPWCAFPGAYVSMPAPHFEARYQVAVGYLPVPGSRVRDSTCFHRGTPDLLVSFVGSPTHPARARLFEARHPRGVFTRVDRFLVFDVAAPDYRARQAQFLETLSRSKFVLCPRGHGTSSFRLYETMAAGRVPVIIADEWVPPRGPEWERCSVRWPERAPVDALFARLEALEPEAEEMGQRALATFREWFDEPVVFDRIISALERLVAAEAAVRFPLHGVRGRAYARLAAARARSRVRARLAGHV
ncbi:MAG TPA: exostosin family protein [Acidimicrobiia bacterium]|nr:exostosin family protein [Acidimicrobiia bacterium]